MRQRTEDILRVLIKANIERKDRNISAENLARQPAIKSAFKQFSEQSDGFVGELDIVLRAYGGDVGDAAAVSTDKDAFDFCDCGSDEAILLNWTKWEEMLLDTYNSVLSDSAELDNMLFEKIRAQKSELDACQEKIKQFRLKTDH